MNISFLEYYKIILEKVSFDKHLFSKEYQKALRYMDNNEVMRLEKWLREKGYKSELISSKRPEPGFRRSIQIKNQV